MKSLTLSLLIAACLHAQVGGYNQLDINPLSGAPGVVNFTDKATLGSVSGEIFGYAGLLDMAQGATYDGTNWKATSTTANILSVQTTGIKWYKGTGLTVGSNFTSTKSKSTTALADWLELQTLLGTAGP
jgi:hypothetical protein